MKLEQCDFCSLLNSSLAIPFSNEHLNDARDLKIYLLAVVKIY